VSTEAGAVELSVFEPQRGPFPLPVGPDHPVRPPVGERLHPHLRVPGPGGPLQDGFHPGIGRERLSFGDAQRGQLAVGGPVTV
jgi:hypothetical protein